MFAKRQSCYCAFCKSTKKVYKRKHLSFFEVIVMMLFSTLTTYLIWAPFDPRGLMILFLLLGTGEVFYRLRWRQSVICTNCGFDPVIYVQNPELAGQKIKDFLEMRKDDPRFLLKPKLNLPVRRVLVDPFELQKSDLQQSLNQRTGQLKLGVDSSADASSKISLRA